MDRPLAITLGVIVAVCLALLATDGVDDTAPLDVVPITSPTMRNEMPVGWPG